MVIGMVWLGYRPLVNDGTFGEGTRQIINAVYNIPNYLKYPPLYDPPHWPKNQGNTNNQRGKRTPDVKVW